MDFEAAAWKAVRQEFPNIRMRGCTFHWSQAVWRKVQQLGLQVAYQKDPPTHTYIRKLFALPMLPAEHIIPVFNYLKDRAVTNPLADLLEYISSQWILSTTFPPQTWSAFFHTTRTNNDCESWHSALNRRAGKSKLPLYLLAELLAEEAATVSVEAQYISEGTLSRYQRKKYKRMHGRLFDAWEEYMRTSTRDIELAKMLLRKCAGIYCPF